MAAKMTKADLAIKEQIDRLSGDALDATSMTIDWQEARGDDGEGWRSKEANACDKCGAVVLLDCGDGGTHSDLYSDGDECPQCRRRGNIESNEKEGEEFRHVCTDCGFAFVPDDPPCDGYVSTADGPMMNYWYPVEIDDIDAAARELANLPLCVVEFRDGRTGLALTGGGMDLSWEICEAFIKIGYLPPFHFCDLPAMAGLRLDARRRLVIAACRATCDAVAGRAKRATERIDHLVKSIKRDSRKRRA